MSQQGCALDRHCQCHMLYQSSTLSDTNLTESSLTPQRKTVITLILPWLSKIPENMQLLDIEENSRKHF